jgi:II/X family phage/plasmid replication protein
LCALLIDWLTLRIPLGETLGMALTERIRQCMNTLHCVNSDGEVLWTKRALDIDALRSDTMGLCWMIQSDGENVYLCIGGSPASLEHGINVFGSCDIRHGAKVLIQHAQKALKAVLPSFQHWQCRRIDVTGNYVLPNAESVKQALQQLSVTDGGRRKANRKKGDSVYWNESSDLAKGKAYHKGPQLAMLRRKGKVECSDEDLTMADRILRFEHTRGSRWFRRLCGRNWYDLTTEELKKLYLDFFGEIVGAEWNGGTERNGDDMERAELVKRIQDANGITEGRAKAAFTTYRNIQQDGFEIVKGYMQERTFYLHLKHLRAAGVSNVDLRVMKGSNVIKFPMRVILAQPVGSWDELRRLTGRKVA